ncbi:Metallothionein expression activator [Elasticomyces elasticus]|uniref:Metallothionein expression activator n=1 Tax=Exophiala sideris TaxID=1016849 RepID=A0ABR0JBZ0_9EURO|nr:Metallothionein expression activator [Elasticomyces elasticus]KAK5031224.1 Metallothionein expression activator [Exophiala sideris]KAK5038945.1 Metallothionein expression activator [Exophiala sideris]KAK5060829.1 Metallothionein expression activator [Exophiala sideris]KAK5183741.1 Metallothionein expression activator [Eurotiomycetes sp. CCFEE 6388]
MPGTPYENMTMNAFMQQNHQGMDFSHSPQFFSEMGMPMHASMPNMALMDENTPRYFHATHIVHPPQSNGMSFDARRMSQPDLRVQTQLRPHTPSHQIQSAQFPLTPPFSHHTPAVQYSRSLQTSPAMQSPYPVPMTRGRSLQGIIENEEFKPAFLSTPTGTSFEVADLPTPASRRRVRSPLLPQHSEPTKVKVESRAADEELEFDQGSDSYAPKLDQTGVPILTSGRAPDGSSSPCRPALSPRRMSISDLNLEPGIQASIEETNITLDDIAQYIDGPDPVDNKWTCNFDGCNKKFGRKENIKSHVQTHLGDRQFRCDHCKKCFVRGHDLKRHAKIHTGTKPYPCLCGNSFARHDALTRHRQRGMCIGAFDGVVKKNIKRGRPRKHRPEMEDRLDKASRSRQKTSEAHDAYASSNSSYSNSSWGSPPTENMDNLSIRGTSPFEDMALFGMPQHHAMTMDQMMGFPPDTFSFTPPASPGYSTGNKPTPNYRELTPAELGDIPDLHPSEPSQMLPDLPIMDPGLSVMSAVNGFSAHSLPSLSHSSSSPAADVVAFDFSEMPTDASSTMMSQSSQLQMKLDQGTNDFDTFLDYGSMDMGLDPSIQDFFTA